MIKDNKVTRAKKEEIDKYLQEGYKFVSKKGGDINEKSKNS